MLEPVAGDLLFWRSRVRTISGSEIVPSVNSESSSRSKESEESENRKLLKPTGMQSSHGAQDVLTYHLLEKCSHRTRSSLRTFAGTRSVDENCSF